MTLKIDCRFYTQYTPLGVITALENFHTLDGWQNYMNPGRRLTILTGETLTGAAWDEYQGYLHKSLIPTDEKIWRLRYSRNTYTDVFLYPTATARILRIDYANSRYREDTPLYVCANFDAMRAAIARRGEAYALQTTEFDTGQTYAPTNNLEPRQIPPHTRRYRKINVHSTDS